jgi:bifunctional non-homologous end joining protein LigD
VAGSLPDSTDQLTLPLEPEQARGRLPRALPPMLASAGGSAFDDDSYFFEPWWPGTRATAFFDRGRLRLQAGHLSDPLAAFPELDVIGSQLSADGVVVDGTLLVLDDQGRPDADLLRRRLREPRAGGCGAFVASDLLWVEGAPITVLPFEARRRMLASVLRDADRCVVSRGLRGEGITLAAAVASMGLDAISARRLSARWHPGHAGTDWLRLSVGATPAPEARPLLVLLQRLPLDT